jgi:hypothetical protein
MPALTDFISRVREKSADSVVLIASEAVGLRRPSGDAAANRKARDVTATDTDPMLASTLD